MILRNVSKVFGYAGDAVPALDSVSLTVGRGEFVCVVGASGCGKSTLLNLIGGLDAPTAGEIELPAGATALMFQDAALFPWLTVARNVELALRLGSRTKPLLPAGKAARAERVAELLDAVHLSDFATKRPHELSGGMRQRVALARALAQERNVLLMDEPFGALDAITRDLLHDELERVWRDAGCPIVFVTHNVREAVRLGDRVVLLSSRPGRVAAEFVIDRPPPPPHRFARGGGDRRDYHRPPARGGAPPWSRRRKLIGPGSPGDAKARRARPSSIGRWTAWTGSTPPPEASERGAPDLDRGVAQGGRHRHRRGHLADHRVDRLEADLPAARPGGRVPGHRQRPLGPASPGR